MDEYYYYAGCIFLISSISMGVSLYETRKVRSYLWRMHPFLSYYHMFCSLCDLNYISNFPSFTHGSFSIWDWKKNINIYRGYLIYINHFFAFIVLDVHYGHRKYINTKSKNRVTAAPMTLSVHHSSILIFGNAKLDCHSLEPANLLEI